MFDFLHRRSMQSPSGAILRSLEAADLPHGTDASKLGVVESHGRYAGRKVTFWRVFDPTRAAAGAVEAFTGHAYRDFDARRDLVLRAGFVERDGTVVHDSRPAAPDAAVPVREPADRAAHADVERFIFPGTDRARAEARS
jgi:hypothetical protein